MTTFHKLWQLLIPDQRRSVVVLLVLMLVGMVLETLGIGLIIPAMAVMTKGDLTTKFPASGPVLEMLGNPNQNQLVVGGMLTLVVVYAVKSLFLGFLAWRLSRFSSNLAANLSYRLFAGYLRQPYSFHLQRNSAQLIRNTINSVGGVTNVAQQCLILISEGFVLIGFSALLLWVEPLGALIVGATLGVSAWSFHRVTRARITRWGKASQYHEGLRIQHLQQGLGGAKDVKLLGREGDFLGQYHTHNVSSARISARTSTLQALPRLWLELLAVTGLAALVLIMVEQGKPFDVLVPTVGLFAAAAFRLMPSINRVLAAVQGIRFSVPSIDTVYADLCIVDIPVAPTRGAALPFSNALTLNHIEFQYPSAAAPSLRGVCLSIPRGTSVGFIGGSGAGKSTLVDIILGLLTPERGTVSVDGVDIQGNLRGWQDQIGYVPQSIFLTDDTLRRNIAFGLPNEQIDETAVKRALHSAQLEQFVSELPQGLDTVVGERGIRLSGGQRQRIGIARALYHNPDVLVLDEATSSLDMKTEHGVMDAVRALKGEKTLLIVAHRLSTVESCDRLYRLEQGRVIEEGSAVDVLRRVASAAD
ncbi:MAG: ABC transporter ATP-binding protein [Candidatus Saccharibacteria bacterium]|nr:ABC transporter ATP-binding protein [Rhodoferax sp.]